MTNKICIKNQNKPTDSELDQQRLVIRMQLYKEVYVLNQGEIRNYGGNVAADRAKMAVAEFDRIFSE
ncbi:hypothetical protein [Cycloclasticus pugetii]|uniref:hypothetical protein n=1 Tax=Cycloclasticus pugetii TaxID=34068 RepID=UPI002409A497|nr:hypothetical protein [Cycloclasticus pugetii]MDF1830647.1 hypothetical protein [Cycloclasticus pugetii]